MVSRRDPRDVYRYTLTVQPDAGPSFRVELDMMQVRLAGDLHPRDPSEAEVQAVFSQIQAHARQQRINLQGVDLARNKTQLKSKLRLMGSLSRVNDLIYRAAGSIPDPTVAKFAQIEEEIHTLTSEHHKTLANQRREAEQDKDAALAAERAANEKMIRALREQLVEDAVQLAQAVAQMQQAVAQRPHDAHGQQLEAELRAANEKLGTLEQELKQARWQQSDVAVLQQDLARKNVQVTKLKGEVASWRQLLAQGVAAPQPTSMGPEPPVGVDDDKTLG